MARGGRVTDEKVSFFAFQDIITAVIGILVLIALILALQVNPKSEDPGDNPDEALSPVELITGESAGERAMPPWWWMISAPPQSLLKLLR